MLLECEIYCTIISYIYICVFGTVDTQLPIVFIIIKSNKTKKQTAMIQLFPAFILKQKVFHLFLKKKSPLYYANDWPAVWKNAFETDSFHNAISLIVNLHSVASINWMDADGVDVI